MLPITPDMLAGAYEYLRACLPYRRWRLPTADEVAFKVVRDPGVHGYYQFKNGHNVGVSEVAVGSTDGLLKVMAHEMIHLRQYVHRLDTPGAVHNADFRKTAQRVCRLHGWDEKMFFF